MAKSKFLQSYTIPGCGIVIEPGDCVLMRPSQTSALPYVAEIVSIRAQHGMKPKLFVRWYYRPEECTSGRESFHGTKELFCSDHDDTQSVDSVEGKCIIHSIDTFMKLDNESDEDFYCRFRYNRADGTLEPLHEIAVYCKCQAPYNPDNVMIQCEKCTEWFHPACIAMTIEEANNIEHFCCQTCVENGKNFQTEDPKDKITGLEKFKVALDAGLSNENSTKQVDKDIARPEKSKRVVYSASPNEKPTKAVDKLKDQEEVAGEAKSKGEGCTGESNGNSIKNVDEVKNLTLAPEIQEIFVKCEKSRGEGVERATEGFLKTLREHWDNMWSDEVEREAKNFCALKKDCYNVHAAAFISELATVLPDSTLARHAAVRHQPDKLEKVLIAEKKGGMNKISEKRKVALIYNEGMLLHEPPSKAYVEVPERLTSIMHKLKEANLCDRCDIFNCEEANSSDLLAVHSPIHVEQVQNVSTAWQIERDHNGEDDLDMYYSKGTSKAALLAAGGTIKACELVAKGMYSSSFALVRPPGHHAGDKGPAGFCFLNNISIGATYLLQEFQMERIMIIDWDVHHGNGTQEIFYRDKRVLFLSIHRHGQFYPYSGDGKEIGAGYGAGFNINICWGHENIRDIDYLTVWDYIVIPVVKEFKPEIILISAGFDAARGDRLGKCLVTPTGFALLLEKILPFGRTVMALEGGYNKPVTAECVASCVKVLLGDKSDIYRNKGDIPRGKSKLPYNTTWDMIIKTRTQLIKFWKVFKNDIPVEVSSRNTPYKHEKGKAKEDEKCLHASMHRYEG